MHEGISFRTKDIVHMIQRLIFTKYSGNLVGLTRAGAVVRIIKVRRQGRMVSVTNLSAEMMVGVPVCSTMGSCWEVGKLLGNRDFRLVLVAGCSGIRVKYGVVLMPIFSKKKQNGIMAYQQCKIVVTRRRR